MYSNNKNSTELSKDQCLMQKTDLFICKCPIYIWRLLHGWKDVIGVYSVYTKSV